jgi:hypothetical protein
MTREEAMEVLLTKKQYITCFCTDGNNRDDMCVTCQGLGVKRNPIFVEASNLLGIPFTYNEKLLNRAIIDSARNKE